MQTALSPPQYAQAIGESPVVRVVFPSGSCRDHLDALHGGIELLEHHGCSVRYDPIRGKASWRDYLSGSDSVRLEDVCNALTEPDVDIVWFGRGGSGCNRITQDVIRFAHSVSPRIVIGFSDATSLLSGLAQQLGWVCYHGPVVTTLARPDPVADLDLIFRLLRGEQDTLSLDKESNRERIQGRLFGGNLTVLASMLGGPMAPHNVSGAIWLLEDVGEDPYRLDRSFRQLCDSGLFDDARGIWLGDFCLKEGDQARVEALITEDAPCPVLTKAPAGHSGVLALLPIGSKISIGEADVVSQWVER